MVSVSSVAGARYREAMFNSRDKERPEGATVILQLLKHGLVQHYHEPLLAGHHDLQELAKTYRQVALALRGVTAPGVYAHVRSRSATPSLARKRARACGSLPEMPRLWGKGAPRQADGQLGQLPPGTDPAARDGRTRSPGSGDPGALRDGAEEAAGGRAMNPRSTTVMLEYLKRIVRRSPLAGPARRLYHALRPLPLNDAERRNAQYDAETEAVMARILKPDSTCLDIGAHKGSVLTSMVRLAPRARHWAFEPLPAFATQLRAEFPQVQVCEVALSDTTGTVTFRHVVRTPAYSGLRERAYPGGQSEPVETIMVQAARLDDLVPPGTPVRFIKVDVEGGELQVFRGGQRVLIENQPVVVFEHGLGAAEYYGTRPEHVYDLLATCGLGVTLMASWLAERPPLSRAAFVRQFARGRNFYFMAYPGPRHNGTRGCQQL